MFVGFWGYHKTLHGRKFKKYFQHKHPSKRHSNGKIKEFHEMKLEEMILDDYAIKLIELIRNFPYIKYEKVRIQCFLCGLH